MESRRKPRLGSWNCLNPGREERAASKLSLSTALQLRYSEGDKAGSSQGAGCHGEPPQSPYDEVSPGHLFPAEESWEHVVLPLCQSCRQKTADPGHELELLGWEGCWPE